MYCAWPELGRCCLCMPLRRGVLTFGYIHIFFSAFMIGMYSYSINYAERTDWLIYSRAMSLPLEFCVAFFCFDLVFDGLLIYGVHKRELIYLKSFFYYTITTCMAMLAVQMVNVVSIPGHMFLDRVIAKLLFSFVCLCIQIYLIVLVRSLIRKLEISGPNVYDNQLHQIVHAEHKVECNGVYNNTTVVPTY